jgi:hypothetical protein
MSKTKPKQSPSGAMKYTDSSALSKAAGVLGQKGGSRSSNPKTYAARINGAKGGRGNTA